MVCQWLIAALSNDARRLARYAGIAKGGLAGGLAAVFGMEAAALPQLKVLAFSFSLQFTGLFCMLGVCWKCVQPTNYFKEDTVIVPLAIALKAHEQEQAIEGTDPLALGEVPGAKSPRVIEEKVTPKKEEL